MSLEAPHDVPPPDGPAADVYRRWFRVTDGPLLDALARVAAERERARAVVEAFCAEVGALGPIVDGLQGRVLAITFAERPDPASWRPCGAGGFFPGPMGGYRWTDEVVALRRRVQSLPCEPPDHVALEAVGLAGRSGLLVVDDTFFLPSLRGTGAIRYVSVPWSQRPDVAACQGILRWQPPPGFVEIDAATVARELPGASP